MASPQVAAASVLVREALQERGMDASPASILETLRSSADLVHDPISGADVYRLNLQRAISGLPPLDDAGAEPALDLIDLSTIKHTDVVDFDRNQWYEIEPTRSGTLSLVATNDGSFLSGTERASLVALDHAGTEIFRGSLASLSQVDLPVTEGQTIRLRLTGDSSVSAHVVNAVSLANGKLDVTGSNYDDTVKLDLANGVALHVNGAEYKFRSADVRSIDMDLGLGNDRFEATDRPMPRR